MRTFTLLVLSALLLTGCSKNIPISGTVTFKDDGSPVPTGMVVFDDGTSMARGEIDSNGRYVMGFEKARDGVPPGSYTVTIVGAVEYLPNPQELLPAPYRELIDPKYSDKDASELTFVVDGKQRIFDIQVDRVSEQQARDHQIQTDERIEQQTRDQQSSE